jgi:chemotaxis protein MotB
MSRKKRKHEEEHENMERWLVSYADFITLLFAFFVTMYAVSRVDEQKLGSAVESLQRALGSLIPVSISSKDPGVLEGQKGPLDIAPIAIQIVAADGTPETEQFEKMAEGIRQEVQKTAGAGRKAGDKGGPKDKPGAGEAEKVGESQESQIQYIIDKRGLIIRVPERFFFQSGRASIRPEIIPILNTLAKSLEKVPNHIRIEGHTDSVPINTFLFPSNWELSTARATTIIRHLLANYDFDPSKISATGYAEYRPVASNATPEGRMQNRRVDFVILSTKETETEPQKDKKEKAASYSSLPGSKGK